MIVQKSLHEGFGLTVTEAMWKARPVVASAVGGIQDQIDDGRQGLLVRDPAISTGSRARWRASSTIRVLAGELATAAQRRVLERYLGLHSLLRYGALIEALESRSATAAEAASP